MQTFSSIQEKVLKIKGEISAGNPFGEKVYLVAATKTRSAEESSSGV